MSIPTRAEVQAQIAQRLAEDPAFREALLEDPRSAVSAVVGFEIPEAVTISVHEESLTDVHIVIPAAAGDEVSEEDLELVSGGVCWSDTCAGCGGCV